MSTVSWYDDNADRLVRGYEAIDVVRLHGWLGGLLPAELGVAFDIGSGSGRDAAWLASLGHEVVGIEPSAAMRAHATRLHDVARLRWVDDSLPALLKLTALGLAADLILVSGVWQHVAPLDRPRAFRKLAALLRSGGVLAITLRNGPAEDARQMHPTCAGEIEDLARSAGMAVERVIDAEDALGRPGVTWTNVALRLPDDGTGALPLLRHLILNDQKSSTYKLGLLRALCQAADSSGGLARENPDGAVDLPLGIVALNWLRLYLPLVRADLPQSPTNRGATGLGFAREGFRALLAGAVGQLDLRVGASFSGERAVAVHAALWDAADTIVRMPATFLTYPNGGPIFPAVRLRRTAAPATVTLDGATLASFGTIRVPGELWRAMRRFASWIEPSLVFEWVRLMRGYATGRGEAFNEAAAAAAMTWSEPERDVVPARRSALAMLEAGLPLECVWTGRRLEAAVLDIDHCLPWSAWPCGDLWNLMPAHREVNQRLKRERLPSALTLSGAGPAIRRWWSTAYLTAGEVTRVRFAEEAAASLPTLHASTVSADPGTVFTALEIQRLRLRQDQRVPEWDRPGG